jgi:hypothetical protein
LSGPHAERGALLFAGDVLALFLFVFFSCFVIVEHGSQSSERSMMTSQLGERKKTVASNCFGDGFVRCRYCGHQVLAN